MRDPRRRALPCPRPHPSFARQGSPFASPRASSRPAAGQRTAQGIAAQSLMHPLAIPDSGPDPECVLGGRRSVCARERRARACALWVHFTCVPLSLLPTHPPTLPQQRQIAYARTRAREHGRVPSRPRALCAGVVLAAGRTPPWSAELKMAGSIKTVMCFRLLIAHIIGLFPVFIIPPFRKPVKAAVAFAAFINGAHGHG